MAFQDAASLGIYSLASALAAELNWAANAVQSLKPRPAFVPVSNSWCQVSFMYIILPNDEAFWYISVLSNPDTVLAETALNSQLFYLNSASYDFKAIIAFLTMHMSHRALCRKAHQ